MKSLFKRLLSLCLCLVLVAVALPVSQVNADEVDPWTGIEYHVYINGVAIVGYSDNLSGHLIIPDTIEGVPVRYISSRAFAYTKLTQVTIPASVIRIDARAFEDPGTLCSIVFLGDAPDIDADAFGIDPAPEFWGLLEEPFTGTISYSVHSSGWAAVSNAYYRAKYISWNAIHDRDEGTITTAATCTTDGSYQYTCLTCGEIETETIPALGHSWDSGTSISSATCTTDGIISYVCNTCSEIKINTTPALGHSWDNGTVTTQPTCTEAGVRCYTCKTCSETREEAISATGHSWDNGTVTTQPTCTEAGVRCYTCKTCSETREEAISATGHSWGETVVVGTPNCLEAVTVDHICTQCGTVGNRQTLTAPGHRYESTIEAATCTQPGRIVYTCKTCGDVRSTETSPATGHQFEGGSCIHCGLKSLPVEGVCGDDLRWYLSEDGTLTISGTGPMYPYAILEDGNEPNTPWYSYRQFIRNVVIEPGATTVGEYAFHGCAEITGVTLPETVTDIGKLAFYGCTGLTELTLPEGVITIGSAAFRRCGNLTSVTLPESVTTIGKIAFFDCTSLTQILIPKGVASIGEYAFGNCTGLKTVTFTGSAPTMDDNSLKNVTAAATYPCGNETWTDAVTQSYGGSLIWEAAHSYESTIEAATCTQPGQTVHTCKTCGDTHSAETSPATGHSKVTDPAIAATCTTSGLTEGKHCSTCNAVLVAQESIPATGHSYKTAVVNPTCTENGSIANTCTSCGDTVTGIIPATGHAFENGSCIHCGEPEAVSLSGDVNGDGKVNIMDVAKLYAHIKGTLLIEDETQLRQADLTGDGNVNILDIAKLYASVKGTAV